MTTRHAPGYARHVKITLNCLIFVLSAKCHFWSFSLKFEGVCAQYHNQYERNFMSKQDSNLQKIWVTYWAFILYLFSHSSCFNTFALFKVTISLTTFMLDNGLILASRCWRKVVPTFLQENIYDPEFPRLIFTKIISKFKIG